MPALKRALPRGSRSNRCRATLALRIEPRPQAPHLPVRSICADEHRSRETSAMLPSRAPTSSSTFSADSRTATTLSIFLSSAPAASVCSRQNASKRLAHRHRADDLACAQPHLAAFVGDAHAFVEPRPRLLQHHLAAHALDDRINRVTQRTQRLPREPAGACFLPRKRSAIQHQHTLPARARSYAAAHPAGPAPAIRTSYSNLISLSLVRRQLPSRASLPSLRPAVYNSASAPRASA